MAQIPKEITIKSFKKNEKRKNFYIITGTDDVEYSVNVSEKRNYTPNDGDTIAMYVSQYNESDYSFWKVAESKAGVPAKPVTPGKAKATGGGGSKGRNWDEFNNYTINVRDPKIELQTWVGIVKDLFVQSGGDETKTADAIQFCITKSQNILKKLNVKTSEEDS